MDYERLKTIQHHNLAIMGGFLGAYGILARCDIFANAQTMNLISLILAVAGRNYREMGLRLLAVVVYVGSIVLCTVLQKRNVKSVKLISLGILTAVILMEFLIPDSVEPILALLPLFFAMPFQWCAFPGGHGYVSATIFSSNNTKQTTVALVEYVMEHDKEKLRKAGFFLGSLLCFHVGVALYVMLQIFAETKGMLFGMVILIPAWGITLYEMKKYRN